MYNPTKGQTDSTPNELADGTKVTQKELSSVKSLKKESDKLVKKQKDIQEKLTPLSSKKNRERVKIRAENIQKKLKQSIKRWM